MTPTGFSIELTVDDAEVRAAIARLEEFPDDRAEAMWDAIGAAMVASTQARFLLTQTSPEGEPWKPSQRFLRDGAPPTLTERGYLRQSQTHNVTDDGVEWGSPLVYAGIHQHGGTIHREARDFSVFRKIKDGALSPTWVKRRKADFEQRVHVGAYDIKMPARPYLGISAEDEATIEGIADRHLEAALLDTAPGSL